MDVIDQNEAETVGLMRADLDFDEDFVGAQAFDVEYLKQFVERCEEMGWSVVDLYIMEDHHFPLVAHERGDDQGIYVMTSPLIPDEEDDDE